MEKAGVTYNIIYIQEISYHLLPLTVDIAPVH